jgi:hypothetical protein
MINALFAMHNGHFYPIFRKISLKINFITMRIHAYFDLIGRKKVILKKDRIFSHWTEFFPQICSQPYLGPGNSA